MHFAPGHRPTAQDVARLASRPAETTKHSVSLMPEPDEGWLELIAMGLTFDVSGLAPLEQAEARCADHHFGLEAGVADQTYETVRLAAGPHLSGARQMLPVLRILAGLGAELARLPGLRAVGWETAASRMSPAYFMSAVRAWLVGGAFPALGLTAFRRMPSGAMLSQGLTLFTGYEVLVDPREGEAIQETAKLAARVVHILIQSGPDDLSILADQQGQPVSHSFDNNMALLRVCRLG